MIENVWNWQKNNYKGVCKETKNGECQTPFLAKIPLLDPTEHEKYNGAPGSSRKCSNWEGGVREYKKKCNGHCQR